jgi:DNA-binding NtrC family response regulator
MVLQYSVLVVEDEPLIRLSLVETLEDEGYRVFEASNVLHAVALIGRYPEINAVVTDVDMPGALNGLDLMRMLARCHPAMAVIVTSGRHALADADLSPGCRFLSKPYDLGHLMVTLAMQIRAATRALAV